MALWGLYLLLTVVEMLALKFIGGMSVFDAVNHAFTTMPSGGFSTRDASIAHYDSAAIEIIIIVFMFLAGVNFTLMWLMGTGDFKAAIKDEEFRTYFVYIGTAVLIITLFGACRYLARPCTVGYRVSRSFHRYVDGGMHLPTMQHGPVLHASSCCC